MKTVGDLALMLKQLGIELTLRFDGKRFHVATASVDQHAVHLSDALEHVAEEYRRRANLMEPIRDDGKGKAGDAAKAPTANQGITFTMKLAPAQIPGYYAPGSSASTPATAPAPTPRNPLCPKCTLPPSWGNGITSSGLAWGWHCSTCGTNWDHPVSDGDVIMFAGNRWKFNAAGKTMLPVTP